MQLTNKILKERMSTYLSTEIEDSGETNAWYFENCTSQIQQIFPEFTVVNIYSDEWYDDGLQYFREYYTLNETPIYVENYSSSWDRIIDVEIGLCKITGYKQEPIIEDVEDSD